MHEMSLMAEVIRTLHASALEYDLDRITRVRLVVGRMTHAMPDALRFAFEVMAREPFIKGAVLEIDHAELTALCKECGNKFELKEYELVCPFCKSQQIKVLTGREMVIDFFEGE